MNQEEQIVLSGIRATGRLHFGNFLGAVNQFVRLQQSGAVGYYFIADLHTLTTLDNPEDLRGNVLEIAKDYLAAGLEPEKSVIYVQSSVPETIELMLYLGMLQPLGDLTNVPTYKELVRKHPDRVSHGLLSYPVLMAADILGVKATLVPVGSDQIPNVEMARTLARKFNARYGPTFIVPEMMEEMVKVPGLDGGKMGKSDAENAVDINSPIDVIGERYAKHGVTDPQKIRKNDPGDPYNRCKSIYPMHEIVTANEAQTRNIANQCIAGTLGCRDCKVQLIESLRPIIEPYQARRAELADKDDYVREVLHEGGKRVRSVVQATVAEVREMIGIRIY